MENGKIKLLVVSLSLVTLSSCSNAIDASVDPGTIVSTASALVYVPIPDRETGQYVAGDAAEFTYGISSSYGEDKPMVSMKSFLSEFYSQLASAQNPFTYTVAYEDNVYTYNFSGGKGTMTVDFSSSTITFSNYTRVHCIYESAIMDPAATGLTSYPNYAYSSDNEGLIEKGEVTIFDLGNYNIPLYQYNEDAYLPIEMASYLFLSTASYQITYNGTAFYAYSGSSYLYTADSSGETAQLTPYGRSYYGGAFASRSEKSSEIARLEANEMLFYLDHFYGFRDNNTNVANGWKSYLSSSYNDVYQNLYSTNADNNASAIDSIMMTIIGDGHTGTPNSYGILGSYYNGGVHNRTATRSARSNAIYSDYATNLSLRAEAFGNEGELGDRDVEISGKTGIIRFDSFMTTGIEAKQTTDTYKQYKSYDNYALFVYAFRTFAEHDIERVVIDLSLNSGGMAIACVETLGFLMDTVNYATYNPLTGDAGKFRVNVDADADGTISGHDSYAGKYELYVLTSNFSFSCGNWFPTVCKDNGIKIIGEKSGGGACVVQNGITPSGQPFQISGITRLSNGYNGGSSDNDAGINVDYEVSKDCWYDIAKLDSYLANLQ